MRRLISVLFDEMSDTLLFLAFARPKTMHGELRYHRQQQQKRRLKITDTEREDLLARWTERTSQGERPGTVKERHMSEDPHSRFHGKVKVQKEDIEIQVNIFEDTREKLYQELNHAFLTLGKWVGSAPKPAEPVATAAAKPAAARPGNGGSTATKPPNAPTCQECGFADMVERISWTDTKTGEIRNEWKCQRCKKWLSPKKKSAAPAGDFPF